jgi:X-Pro dipeptidyl-peptidase (S15 family)
MTPWRMLPEAIEFARRGWAAVIMMRRGYGDSGGGWVESNGGCANPDYVASGVASSVDLKGAVAALARRPDIDASRVISVGISAGGFATVALAADPPPGLVAAISFAGGRGSVADDEVCREERLTAAFATFGKRARVPMLWVYAANDHYFRPALAQEFKRAFMAGGGIVEFVAAPAFGTDGHGLFSPAGIPIWSRYVDKFLESRNLVLRERLLPPLRPSLRAPSVLSANGRNDFESYLTSGPHKAFAVSPRGAYGWRIGQRTVDAARTGALELCEANGSDCSVVFVDDAAIPKGRATR